MPNGDLVYIDGNQAAIVIGEGVGEDGQPDGSVIVGTFAAAKQVERGHYGQVPSVAGENPPSFTPEGAGAVVGDPGPIVVASAGDQATPEATTDPTQESATQSAGDGGVLDVGTPLQPGDPQAEVTRREETQDERIARLETELRTARGDTTATQTDIGGQGDQGADLGGVPAAPGAPDAPTPST